MTAFVVEVRLKGADPKADWVLARCRELGLAPGRVRTARLYRFEGDYRRVDADRAAKRLFADPVTEAARVAEDAAPAPGAAAVDVWYRPEVSDPAAESVEKGLRDLGLAAPDRVRCGRRTVLAGLSRREAERAARKILANPVVHEWRIL